MSGNEDDDQGAVHDGHQTPTAPPENPFDHEAAEMISNIHQQLQQRLLGSQSVATSTGSNPAHATQTVELQQAHNLIAQLQR